MTEKSALPLALQCSSLSYSIRPVSLSDAKSLQISIWQHRDIDSVKDFVKRILKFEKQQRGLGIVVLDTEYSNTPIAYGQVTQWIKCAEISDLLVREDYRRQSIGTAMVQYLINYIRPRASCVELGVALSNPRALALYQRLGFQDSYTLHLDLGNGKEPVLYLQIDFEQFR